MHIYIRKVNSIHFFIIYHRDYDQEQFADNHIPLLVIGTKLDQIHETRRHEVLTRTAFLAEDFNAEEINLVCIFTNACLQVKAKPETSQVIFSLKKLYAWNQAIWVLVQNVAKIEINIDYQMGIVTSASLYAYLLECSNVVLWLM